MLETVRRTINQTMINLQKNNQAWVMGVINASPNSFYNAYPFANQALAVAERMIEEGVDILDIGGEATNPTVNLNDALTVQLELDRVIPLISSIKSRFDILISVDTSQPEVMRQAIAAGADMINDQRALSLPGAVEAVVDSAVSVCLMHWQLPPRRPGSSSPDVLLNQTVSALLNRAKQVERAGISGDRIILDPGFGGGNYGKSAAENAYLLQQLAKFVETNYPILVGWSRKSMIGELTGAAVEERLPGSIAAAVLAVSKGAKIIRAHDVAATKQALAIVHACAEQ